MSATAEFIRQGELLRKERRHVHRLRVKLRESKAESYWLALLASEKAEFFNPLHVARARQIRDRILADRQ